MAPPASSDASASSQAGGAKRTGGGDDKKSSAPEPVVLAGTPAEGDFSLDEYLDRYSGRAEHSRALFIAQRCPELKERALTRAVQAIRQTNDTTLYRQVVEQYGALTGEAGGVDQGWIDQTDKRAAHAQERLEVELNQFKANLVRDKIRQGHSALGDFHMLRGDMPTALKCFVRTRDYCQSPAHLIEMCMSVIKVSIDMGNFAHVLNYVSKAEQNPSVSSDDILVAQLNAVSGLAHLSTRKYKFAAKKFLACPNALVTAHKAFDSVISPQDIALYGGLCGLATYTRAELRNEIIENKTFAPFLALQPVLKEVISNFYSSKYGDCLAGLERLKPVLRIDVHLAEHVASLFQKVRSRAMVQYFSPYSSTDLTRMAAAFNSPVDELERELAKLIMEDQIQARIDSHGKQMHTSHSDQRVETFETALRLGEEYADNVEEVILRANLMRKNFIYRPKHEGGESRGDGGRRNKRDKTEA